METAKPDSRPQILFMALALAATLPGVYLRITGIHPEPVLAAILYGMAIVGAAFILSWAAEIIQMDIAAGLALALLALIAILPEYAVDFVFTARAGQEFAETGQATRYGPLALANMTGGNQLLIGLGWPMVILIGTWRVRKTGAVPSEAEGTTATEIHLARGQSVDIAYLTIASLYGLTLFLKDTLSLFDAVVLITIYVLYLRRLSGAPTHEPHLVGPSAYVGSLPKRTRRIINYTMFVISAGVILLCAEAFADSIIELGEAIGVSDFLLVKWIAPTASEAPELLVATLFAWRLAITDRAGRPHLVQGQPMDLARRLAAHRVLHLRRRSPRAAARHTAAGRARSSPRRSRSSPSPSWPAARSVAPRRGSCSGSSPPRSENRADHRAGAHLAGCVSIRPGSGSASSSSSPRHGSCARISEPCSPTCATGCALRGASSPPKSTSRPLRRTPSNLSCEGRIFGGYDRRSCLGLQAFHPCPVRLPPRVGSQQRENLVGREQGSLPDGGAWIPHSIS